MAGVLRRTILDHYPIEPNLMSYQGIKGYATYFHCFGLIGNYNLYIKGIA